MRAIYSPTAGPNLSYRKPTAEFCDV